MDDLYERLLANGITRETIQILDREGLDTDEELVSADVELLRSLGITAGQALKLNRMFPSPVAPPPQLRPPTAAPAGHSFAMPAIDGLFNFKALLPGLFGKNRLHRLFLFVSVAFLVATYAVRDVIDLVNLAVFVVCWMLIQPFVQLDRFLSWLPNGRLYRTLQFVRDNAWWMIAALFVIYQLFHIFVDALPNGMDFLEVMGVVFGYIFKLGGLLTLTDTLWRFGFIFTVIFLTMVLVVGAVGWLFFQAFGFTKE